jgi:hypothetical protein
MMVPKNDPLDNSTIGIDLFNQSIVIWFGGASIDRLVISPEQAAALAADLTEKARLLQQQQNN